MSSTEAGSRAPADVKWTPKTLARELVIVISASAGVITLLMLLKELQSLI